jgi:signal transduction histidine kinase
MGGVPLYITVCPRDCGPAGLRCHGAVSAGPDISADRLAIDARLLETMLGARAREDELRRETETMLMGLRALLAPRPFIEKLADLARLLADAVRSGDMRVLQQRAGESPRLLLPEAAPAPATGRMLADVLRLAEGHAVTHFAADSAEAARLRAALGAPRGAILLVAMPFRHERLYLVLGARAGAQFGPRETGLAERFSLLLQQAAMLRDDQAQMVHAAKLSALGQMSTSIAHELRQPLNTISIASQNIEVMLERGEVPPDVLREKMERIQRQVERAGKVMDRMRRFGRKSGGEIQPADLGAIAAGARAMMEHVTERSGVAVTVEIAENTIVLADEMEIEQVLVNLIQNASDAIAAHRLPGRPDGRIRIWEAQDEADREAVQLHVDDNGPGFPPEILQHAMDAFFTTKSQTEGTGLGLSISNAILREHGGRLTAGNWEKGGRVTLHLRRPAPPSATIIPLARGRKEKK